jgi:uncharacterized protein YwqG
MHFDAGRQAMSDLKALVIDACRRKVEQGMPPVMAEAIIRLLRPSIRLLPQPAQETRLGGSRIGGLPDLPEGAQWPAYPGPSKPDAAWEAFKGEPLAFLLQVNLAEVAPFDVAGQLPPTGMLHFFYLDAMTRFGVYPIFGEVIQVLYTPQEEARPRRLASPQNLPSREIYRGFALSPRLEWTIPRCGDLEENSGLGELIQPDDYASMEHVDDLMEEAAVVQGLGPWYRPKHRMLGYPDFIQADGCGPGNWKLLLQVDSDPRFSTPSPFDDPDYPGPGMMWGDSGRIFFGIEQGDLTVRNFSAVWASFECH